MSAEQTPNQEPKAINREQKKGGLVLYRRRGQSFFINVQGVEIEVMVLGFDQRQAAIRIVAPKDVEVLRSELKKAKESQNP